MLEKERLKNDIEAFLLERKNEKQALKGKEQLEESNLKARQQEMEAEMNMLKMKEIDALIENH